VVQKGSGADRQTWAKGSSRGLSQSFANADSQRLSRSLVSAEGESRSTGEGRVIAKAELQRCGYTAVRCVQCPNVQLQPKRHLKAAARVFAERLGRSVTNNGKVCMNDASVASTSESATRCR
jgi:hypothetical protein